MACGIDFVSKYKMTGMCPVNSVKYFMACATFIYILLCKYLWD